MIYVIVGTSLLFIGVAYLVTVDNAKYLLSGYNTMSKAEREKVDIKSYIPFFKKFHIALGLSCLIIGVLLCVLISEKLSGIFITIYPIAAYIYFIKKGDTYFKGTQSNANKLAQMVLIAILIFIIGMIIFKGI